VLTVVPQPIANAAAGATQNNDLPRLDADLPEPQAKEPAAAIAADAATPQLAEESPFSGLKLQVPDERESNVLRPVPANQTAGPVPVAEMPVISEPGTAQSATGPVADQKGFKGFCPVSLRNERVLVKVDGSFETQYGGRTYRFATAEAKDEFDNDPARYIPAGSGFDLVHLLDEDEKVDGTLDYAAWYQGRLYLFASKTNLDLFNGSPAEYAEPQADGTPAMISSHGSEKAPELKSLAEDDQEIAPPVDRRAVSVAKPVAAPAAAAPVIPANTETPAANKANTKPAQTPPAKPATKQLWAPKQKAKQAFRAGVAPAAQASR
jgi:YHS domain-containing protein